MKKIHTHDSTGEKAICGRSLMRESKTSDGVRYFAFLRVVNLRVFNTVVKEHQRCDACVSALDRVGIPSNFFKHQARFTVAAGIASESRCGTN